MLESFSVKWLKLSLLCPKLQICSHRHGEQAVRHAAWWLHGHRPAAHKEGDETDQVEWMGLMARAATENQNNLFPKNRFNALSSQIEALNLCSQTWMWPGVCHSGEEQAFGRGTADRLFLRPLQHPLSFYIQRQPQGGCQVRPFTFPGPSSHFVTAQVD